METTPVFRGALRQLAPLAIPAPVAGALDRLLHLGTLDLICENLRRRPAGTSFAGSLLNLLEVDISVAEADLRKIPATGAVVVVANHPSGLVEAAVLAVLLRRVRPDTKILANSLLAQVPELRDEIIPISPFRSAGAANAKGLRAALEWLAGGGLLAVFPAGEVAHLDLRKRGMQDPAWGPAAARLAQRACAQVVPVHFGGSNSALFHFAGLLHPMLRTALLPHELLNKRKKKIEVRVGYPLPRGCYDTPEMRRRTYWLARRSQEPRSLPRFRARTGLPVPPGWVKEELQALPERRVLAQSGEFEVRLARAPEIPMALREIGRLRELAFRAAGEGSGQSYDLDRFDAWYDHLILWNGVREEIAGAYRLCGSDRGAELYTETLFRFSPHFFTRLGPALELGRSFIGSGYQRNYQSLLLLWRAIGEYVSLNPQYRHLFGPVSISAEYRRESRTMMAAYFEQHCYDSELARLAGARQPFGDSTTCVFPRPESIEDLDSLVRDIEHDGKGLPVLVRQYLKLSGRLCAFHVDRSFGHCLDGLIVVDLLRTARRQVERYLGLPGAERFYRFHKAGGARDGDTIRT